MTRAWMTTFAFVAACTPAPPPPALPAVAEASTTIHWVPVVEPGEDLGVFEASAQVVPGPDSQAAVSSVVRVQIVRVLVRAGDVVQKGAPIAEVLAPELVQAAAVRQSTGLRIAAHERNVQGLRGLQREGMVRTADVFAIESQLADLRAARTEAEARLQGAGATDAEVRLLVTTGRWTLRAPIAGTVREVLARPGAVIEPPAALALLSGLEPARVEIHLHHTLPAGAQLAVLLADGTDLPLAQTPVSVAVDGEDGSTIAWFDAEPARLLAAGTRGRVHISHLPADVMQVPARALLRTEGRAQVVVQRDGRPHTLDVQVVSIAGALALVRGLHPGDRVAAEAESALPGPSTATGAP
jgi:multidrug efflux pump subunit AcrA (membrane-fusion protein)